MAQKICLIVRTPLMAFCSAGSMIAAAGQLPLAEQPLHLGVAAPPNILLLVDDSGSMDWNTVTPQSADGGVIPVFNGKTDREENDGSVSDTNSDTNLDFAYVFSTGDNLFSATAVNSLGSPATIDEMFIQHPGNLNWRTPPAGCANPNPQADQDPGMSGIQQTRNDVTGYWRLWNKDYNALYYDPEVLYLPWAGMDDDGAAFANATPGAARLNAFDLGAGTFDLTIEQPYITRFVYACAGDPVRKTLSGAFNPADGVSAQERRTGRLLFHPARYYTWTADTTDNDGDGNFVDAGDAHQLIEIRSSGCGFNASCPASFPRGPDRTDCPGGTCNVAQELRNFANWFQYYRRRVLTAKAAFSQVANNARNARMGLVTLHDNNGVKKPLRDMTGSGTDGDKRTLLDAINNIRASGGTPLQQAMGRACEYLDCNTVGNSYGFTAHSGTIHASCPALTAESGGECQQNFLVAMTDGFYNDAVNRPAVGNTDADGAGPFDGGAHADHYRDTLGDIAMKYYESDIQPGLANNLAINPGVDEAPHQHVVTFTVAFGLDGTINPGDSGTNAEGMPEDRNKPFPWPDPMAASNDDIPEKIDDLRHAAFNGRGNFLSAKQPQALIKALDDTINSITNRTSSASSVALNSGSLNTGTMLYQARFSSGDWTGELKAFPISSGDGAGCPGVGEICGERWNAGNVLKSQHWNERNIITMKTGARSGGVPFRWDQLDTAEQGFLNFNPDTGAADSSGGARLDYLRGDRSNELPSKNGLGFRARQTPLGDIVNSDPFFVGAPRAPYEGMPGYGSFRANKKSRTPVVYVGANDGMLHGFRASDGHELIAFLPGERSIFEDLSALTSPKYNGRHRYFVDGSPAVGDVQVAGHWKSVLVSGMRRGGQGVFALDVTDPSSFSEGNAGKLALWQFTDQDDPDLGYTYSRPAIAKMRNGQWAAIIGNGYNNSMSTYGSRGLPEQNNALGGNTVSTTGKGYLFILFMDGPGADNRWDLGADYIKIEIDAGSIDTPNGLASPAAVDLDDDEDFVADAIYAGDLLGNLWKFDVSATVAQSWKPAFGGNPLFRACTDGNCSKPQPITVRPEVGTHPDGPPSSHGVLVYFGTGQYMAMGDNTAAGQNTQTFYMIWDTPKPQSGLPISRSRLLRQRISGESGQGGSACSEESRCVRTTSDSELKLSASNPEHLGCFLDFDSAQSPGERIVSDPILRGDRIVFTTLVPSQKSCEHGGSSWLMELHLNCGQTGALTIDVNGDGKIDDSDLVGDNDTPSGLYSDGILPRPTILAIPPGAGGADPVGGSCSELKFMSDSRGDRQRVLESCDYDRGRLSWRQIR